MPVRTLLRGGALFALMSLYCLHSQPANDNAFLVQLERDFDSVQDATLSALKGQFAEAMLMLDDKDPTLALARCHSVAGNLRNMGRPDLAGEFVQVSISVIQDDWAVLEHDRCRAGVYLKKAELAWEFLGDRELATRYVSLGKRASRTIGTKDLQGIDRLNRLSEDLEKFQTQFEDTAARKNTGGFSR